MKLNQTHYLVILAVAFVALAIYTIQLTGSSKAKDNVIEKLGSDALEDLEELEAEREAKKELQEKLKELAQTDFEEGEDLEEQKENLKNEDYENEPYTITDADSLRDIIARRIERLQAN